MKRKPRKAAGWAKPVTNMRDETNISHLIEAKDQGGPMCGARIFSHGQIEGSPAMVPHNACRRCVKIARALTSL